MSLAERGGEGKPDQIKGDIYDILAGHGSSGMLSLECPGKLPYLNSTWRKSRTTVRRKRRETRKII